MATGPFSASNAGFVSPHWSSTAGEAVFSQLNDLETDQWWTTNLGVDPSSAGNPSARDLGWHLVLPSTSSRTARSRANMETAEDEHQPRRTSTAYTRWLGEELRHLRGDRKSSAVANRLGWSIGKLSKLEAGSRNTSDAELGALLGAYEADAVTRERLVRMASDHKPDGFVCVHAGRPADHLIPLALHERLAVAVTHYSPILVPAPIQSEDYANTILSAMRPASQQVFDAAMRARIDRRIRTEGKEAEFLVNESALKPRTDDSEDLAGQLMYLRLVTNAGQVRVRVVPSAAAAWLVVEHPFSIFTLAGHLRPLVSVEMHGATAFIEDDAGVGVYRHQCEVIKAAALSVENSRQFVEQVADWYDRGGAAEWPSAALIR